MKSFIVKHFGDNDDFIMTTIQNHPEWYGKNDIVDLMRVQFWDIVDENCDLLGFFGCTYWQHDNFNECIICYLFIKEEYRQKGLFKKIIKYVKEHNTEYETITIGATWVNKLAYDIYSKHFKYLSEDKTEKGTWFLVKDRR